MPGERVFTANDSRAVSTAITVMQLTAAATHVVEILRMWVTQESSTASAQTAVSVVRQTDAGTMTAITEVEHASAGPADATAFRTATVEPTTTDTILIEGFNVLNGWLYLPVPEERIWIPPSGSVGLKFPDVPPSVTYNYGITWREVG